MSPAVDRARLVAWLRDRARDEEETADHKDRGSRHNVFEVEGHRDIARTYRSIAAAVDRGEPDAFVAPDLSSPKRKSGELRVDLVDAEPVTRPGKKT